MCAMTAISKKAVCQCIYQVVGYGMPNLFNIEKSGEIRIVVYIM